MHEPLEGAGPLISVMMPVYNGGDALVATLANLRLQTWTDWEAVILDDGSTDQTPSILARFAAADPRMRIHRQDNGGRGVARNAVLARCRGELIFVWDGDDLAGLDTLEQAVTAWRTAGPRSIVFAETLWGFNDDRGIHSDLRYPWTSALQHQVGVGQKTVPNPGALIPRAAFAEVGGYDPALRRCQDAHFFWRAASAGWKLAPYQPTLFYRMTSPYYHLSYLRDTFHWAGVAKARLANPSAPPDTTPPKLRLLPTVRFFLARWVAIRRFRASAVFLAKQQSLAEVQTAIHRHLATLP